MKTIAVALLTVLSCAAQGSFGQKNSEYYKKSLAPYVVSPQQIVDILKNARQPMLAICLSDTVRRVRANIQGGKKHCRPAERSAARRKNAS